jgi:hypothetical protein
MNIIQCGVCVAGGKVVEFFGRGSPGSCIGRSECIFGTLVLFPRPIIRFILFHHLHGILFIHDYEIGEFGRHDDKRLFGVQINYIARIVHPLLDHTCHQSLPRHFLSLHPTQTITTRSSADIKEQDVIIPHILSSPYSISYRVHGGDISVILTLP